MGIFYTYQYSDINSIFLGIRCGFQRIKDLLSPRVRYDVRGSATVRPHVSISGKETLQVSHKNVHRFNDLITVI